MTRKDATDATRLGQHLQVCMPSSHFLIQFSSWYYNTTILDPPQPDLKAISVADTAHNYSTSVCRWAMALESDTTHVAHTRARHREKGGWVVLLRKKRQTEVRVGRDLPWNSRGLHMHDPTCIEGSRRSNGAYPQRYCLKCMPKHGCVWVCTHTFFCFCFELCGTLQWT